MTSASELDTDGPLQRLQASVTLGSRSLFPDLSDVYLSWAAIAPPSTAVRAQVRQVLDDYARGGLRGFGKWLPQRDRLRSSLAALIGAAPSEIGFSQSTTSAVLAIARSIDWQRGERIVLFEGEFPANVDPWLHVARDYDLTVDWLSLEPFSRSHEEGMHSLREALERSPRLVAVSAVQFQSGLRMPIEAMGAACRGADSELFVDAIQALGTAPLDVDHLDYLVCGGHKWLGGIEGAGFLYVAQARMEALTDRMAGWLSGENALDFLLRGGGHLRYDRPMRREANALEPGAQSAVGLAALEAGVAAITALGPSAIEAHIQQLHDAYEPLFHKEGFRSLRSKEVCGRSGILSFELPRQSAPEKIIELQQALRESGVVVAIPDGKLRLAPHWPNSLSEVERVSEALSRRN